MSANVGINGFGRMGRLALRAGYARSELRFAHINEIACDAAGAAHLLEFDSVHGHWPHTCSARGNTLYIGDAPIPCTGEKDLAQVDWSGCEIVIEATGKHHKTPELLQGYFRQGVKKVIVAAPTLGALNLVYGINDHLYEPSRHQVLSAASCTTNCLAPLVKVMLESVGILRGTLTTIHDVTNTQSLLDRGHKDLRRARAAGMSLIPTSTGSAKAITGIFPELQGRIDGLAIRVPLANASLVDFVFDAARGVTVNEINTLFRQAAAGPLRGILGCEDRPLVSVDFVNDPRSAIVDTLSTQVTDGTLVKVLAWYDNEWGYVNRLVDLTAKVARSL
ncbi:MAG: ArsJ-associated glyceraldehyde-3-phosphate dehydrogenase [Magnetococcus sp. WYHC-3]